MTENRKDIAADPEDSDKLALDAAMTELDADTGKLPKASIEWIREHRDAAVPRLIEVIRTATASAREGELPEGNAHFLALFLLTEFKVTEAMPAILEAVCLPGELSFELFGDAITSVLARIIPVLATDPTKVLDDLIANEHLNEYIRWEAAQSYLLLVRDGRVSRDEAVGRLADHLRVLVDRADTPAAGYLVSVLVSLAPREAIELINEAYDRDLVDLWIVRPHEVKQSISEGELWTQKELSRCPPTGIDNTIAELETWASYSQESPDRPRPKPPRPASHTSASVPVAPSPLAKLPGRNIGRNEPCPCGSRKKYKKCCGRHT